MNSARNTLINFAGTVTPTLVSLVFVPLYLRLVGNGRYGVLALVWVFLDYFGFFDLGIGKATANQMARLRDASMVEREAVFWTGALINAGFGLLGGLVLFAVGNYLLSGHFGDMLTSDMQDEIRTALPWVAAAVPLGTLSAANVAALEAREQFLVLNVLQVFGTMLFQMLPLAMAYWRGPSLDGLIAASIGGRLTASIPLILACWYYVPLRSRPSFRGTLARPLVRYGGWVTVTAIIGPILVSLDRIIIGFQIGASAVAHYTVPYSLVTKFQILPGSLNRVLFPRFSLLDREECARMAQQAVFGLAAITLPLMLVATILMKPFLNVWVGPEFAKASASVGEVLLIGVWVNNLAWIPLTMLQAQGRPEVVAKFHVIELLPFIIALWIGIAIAGLQGAAWAWVVRVTVDAILLFSAAGLRGRIFSVICVGLGLIIAMQLIIHSAADFPAIRAGALITLMIPALCYTVRVAPSDLWASLVRVFPLGWSRLILTKKQRGVMSATFRSDPQVTGRSTACEAYLWPTHELEVVDRCPLCDSVDRTILHQGLTDRVFFCAPGRWILYRCNGCEGVYLDPRPTLESIARAYSSYYTHEPEGEDDATPSAFERLKRAVYNGYLNAQYKLNLTPALSWGQWAVAAVPPIRLKRDRAARHLPLARRGARLLDIGCGNGAFVKSALAWGWDAEGLDPDPNAAAAGRAIGLPITVGSLPRTNYPEASFAAVTMSHSIEHLHDPVACLREVLRILQPGGTLWIATPNLSSSGHKVFGADWRGLEPPRHLVLFTAATLIATLTRAGFNRTRQVRAPFSSQWYFACSHRISQDEDPLSTNASRLPRRLRLRASIADLQALLQPRCGEEIILIARRPP